jgi:hypothetical protein
MFLRGTNACTVEVWDVVDKADMKKNKKPGRAQGGRGGNDDDEIAGVHVSQAARSRGGSAEADNWKKTMSSPGSHALGMLDASTVDVYRGSHVVLFLYNVADRRTSLKMSLNVSLKVVSFVPLHKLVCVQYAYSRTK